MQIRGNDSSSINVTINETPLNDAESQEVYWMNMPDLVSTMSSIQAQPGVGSSTSGAGAFGAIVISPLPNPFREATVQLNNSNKAMSPLDQRGVAT